MAIEEGSTLVRIGSHVPDRVRHLVPISLRRRWAPAPPDPQVVTDEFHRLFYSHARRTWQATSFMGVPVWKNPMDLWVYQELLFDLRPDLIIESGTSFGGSALFFASMCDLLGVGRVVSIDIERRPGDTPPTHPRITYLLGSSTSDEIVAQVRSMAKGATTLVVLDSDHSRDHVLRELELYGPLVTEGSYLIVEDTNVNGHPVTPSFGPGPMEAVEAFLPTTDEFEVDATREKFYFSFNPGGFLRRTTPSRSSGY